MAGTDHGTPWNYRAQVPMVFRGMAFRSGSHAKPSQPIDPAPKLAAAPGLTQPSDAEGPPLAFILE